MKILYAGELRPGTSCLFRKWALERLGHEVVGFDPSGYVLNNRVLNPIAFRFAIGPHADRLNRDLLVAAERERPDLLWADKLLLLTPKTLRKMSDTGITSVSYMIDNAFGPRRDPGWRMYVKDIPFFDLHVTQREISIGHYMDRGAKHVMKVQTAYEPTIHYPSPVPFTDAERDREVSFIGTPYDNRAGILTRVSAAGIPVVISGNTRSWKRALPEPAFDRMHRFGELYEQQYREAIWKSKINLSFLTKSNQDEYTHKSFEIAGCGGFLLAERCPGHSARFKEDEEAVFFGDEAELLEQIRRYLPDEEARTRIAAAGHARAVQDGYYNDVQVARIVARATEIARESGRHVG